MGSFRAFEKYPTSDWPSRDSRIDSCLAEGFPHASYFHLLPTLQYSGQFHVGQHCWNSPFPLYECEASSKTTTEHLETAIFGHKRAIEAKIRAFPAFIDPLGVCKFKLTWKLELKLWSSQVKLGSRGGHQWLEPTRPEPIRALLNSHSYWEHI